MEEKNKDMKLIIWYNNKGFVIPFKEGLRIEEIKKQCQANFKLEEEDINNLILLYNDNDGSKIIINNIKELFLLENGINNFSSSIELILEINQEIKMLNDNNIIKNIMSNTMDEYDRIINELKNEIENLKNKCEKYEKRIKEMLLKYQQNINTIESTNRISILCLNKNNLVEKKEQNNGRNTISSKQSQFDNNENINEINYNCNFKNEIKKENNQILIEHIINNLNSNDIKKKEKNLLYRQDIQFIKNKCSKCGNQNDNKIFQCVKCENYYLCQACHKENIRPNKKLHEHINFFEIKFPPKLMEKIKLNEKKDREYYEATDKFNVFLSGIFFDKNGNLTKQQFIVNKSNIKIFKNLCNEMNNIKVDLLSILKNIKK